jgi:nucleoside-diphosphate-sugar epimerase
VKNQNQKRLSSIIYRPIWQFKNNHKMASAENLAIPKGSLVVVSGANGYIASNVVDQLLLAGYHVRGTVRSKERASWMQDLLDQKYGSGKFELFEVPDMAAPGAFDDAVQGAAGFAHVATPVMQSFDPNEGVPVVVDGTLNALKAAASQPSIKRVVLTSSSTAAASPQPNKVFTIDSDTWNQEAIEAAWAPPPYEGLQRRLDVYSASKTQGEQAAWKFMKETKPGFVLNAVLPNANMGHILSVEHQGYPSTAGWIKALWDGFKGHEDLKFNPPQYYINVQDNARVHVAALVFKDVEGERLFSFAHPYTWNDILAVFRKLYPNHKSIDDIPDLGKDMSKVANERAEELVKRFGRPGWTSLEESVKDVADTFTS